MQEERDIKNLIYVFLKNNRVLAKKNLLNSNGVVRCFLNKRDAIKFLENSIYYASYNMIEINIMEGFVYEKR